MMLAETTRYDRIKPSRLEVNEVESSMLDLVLSDHIKMKRLTCPELIQVGLAWFIQSRADSKLSVVSGQASTTRLTP